MQYYRPGGKHFVGDCMPFAQGGRYHLFYLQDEEHHRGLGGLGGHQWAHASTTDLVNWEHHPLALRIDEPWECSICTGSVFFHDGTCHAFFATRTRDWKQHLGHAVSSDGVHFTKLQPNPFFAPPPLYSPCDCRDPFVFRDDQGRFQMLVTSRLLDFPVHERGGCLLRLSSADLRNWRVEGPMLIPGSLAGTASVPECPDYFHWNGWYYLIVGQGLGSFYRMSRNPWGPWLRPANDSLGNGRVAVMKTAPFGQNRRIGAAWIGSRQDDRDTGQVLWGGNVVLRELVQMPDGTLGTCFPPEAIPTTGHALHPQLQTLTAGARGTAARVTLDGAQTHEAAQLAPLPHSYRLRCTVRPARDTFSFGLGLRGSGAFESMHQLTFSASRRTVQLAQEQIDCVDGLDGDFTLDVLLHDDVIDVCVGGRRCIIDRLPERRGEKLFFFCHNGTVMFDQIELHELGATSHKTGQSGS